MRKPEAKARITILIDDDVLAAFRARVEREGRGFQTLTLTLYPPTSGRLTRLLLLGSRHRSDQGAKHGIHRLRGLEYLGNIGVEDDDNTRTPTSRKAVGFRFLIVEAILREHFWR
jgi:hypothetical protein